MYILLFKLRNRSNKNGAFWNKIFSSLFHISFKGLYPTNDRVQPGALWNLKCKWIRRGKGEKWKEHKTHVSEEEEGKEAERWEVWY